jgi:hypothetical protein
VNLPRFGFWPRGPLRFGAADFIPRGPPGLKFCLGRPKAPGSLERCFDFQGALDFVPDFGPAGPPGRKFFLEWPKAPGSDGFWVERQGAEDFGPRGGRSFNWKPDDLKSGLLKSRSLKLGRPDAAGRECLFGRENGLGPVGRGPSLLKL